MDFRQVFILFICIATVVMAVPYEPTNIIREKRDVTETMKGALNDAGKTLDDAGDAVVDAVKPTEKSVLDKVADGV